MTAAILVTTAVLSQGWLAASALLLVGLCNSIMFPTIFSLTLAKSPADDNPAASGFMCLGIVGGAIITQCQGYLADAISLQWSFLLPMACYLYIVHLALTTLRPPAAHTETAP